MAQLVNAETGKTEEIAESDVPAAYLSQKYGLPAGPLPVKSPTGKIGTIQPEDAAEAFKAGYVPVTKAEHDEAADKVKYGQGLGNAARAFGGQALSTATLGGSDVLERAISPETAKEESKVRHANPGSSFAGGLLGGVGLTAATGGLGAEALGAEALGVGGRLAADAALGGAFGGGQAVSEAALGDHELTAEHLLAEMGTGALMGGATGLGLWGVGKALSPVLEKAQGAMGDLSETVKGVAQKYGAGAEDIAKGDVTKLTDSLNDALETHRNIGSEMRDEGGIREAEARNNLRETDPEPIRKDLNETVQNAQAKLAQMAEDKNYTPVMVSKAQDIINGLAEDAGGAQTANDLRIAARDALGDLGKGKTFNPKFPSATDENTASVLKDLYGDLKGHLTSEELYGAQGARESAIRDAESGLADKSWASRDSDAVKAFKKEFGYSGSRDLQVDPGKVERYVKLLAQNDPKAAPKVSALEDMMGALKKYSDEAATSHGNVPGDEDFSQYQQLADHQAKTMAGLKPMAETSAEHMKTALGPEEGSLRGLFAKGLDRIPGVGPMAAHVVENPGAALETLSKFSEIAQRSMGTMNAGIKSFMRGTGSTGAPILTNDVLRSARFASGTRGEDDTEKRTKEIDMYAGNPQALSQNVTKALEPIHGHAPNVTEAIAAKKSAQLAYLQQQAPRDPNAQFGAGPSERGFKPSGQQKRQFAGAIAGTTDPVGTLRKMMKTGMVNQKALDAVRATNPKIYEQFQAQIMNELSKQKKPLGHQQRLTLARLTGAPLSVSMTPAGIVSLQAGFTGAAHGSSAPHPKVTSAAINKMDLGSGLEPREPHLGKGR